MPREIFNSPRVTHMRSGVSQAVKHGGLVYTCGVTPFKGDREIAEGDFVAQINQCMTNLTNLLEDCGTSLERAIRLHIVITDMKQYAVFDATYKTWFPDGVYPARMTMESPHLADPRFMVQIDCIAEL